MTAASTRKGVETTLDVISRRTPVYSEIADRFGPVFLSSARLCEELSEKGVAVPPLDPARVAAGVPVLAELDLTPWGEALSHSARALFPELSEVFALKEGDKQALLDILEDAEIVLGLVRARIEGDRKRFENTSVKSDMLTPSALSYISEIVSAPVFHAMAAPLGDSLSSMAWEHGYCPVCGSHPSISLLSPKEVTDLDQLVGGGGKKFLHCSLCGHDWRFKRNACPACGNDENETREVFFADDTQYERIEACHKCGKYCLNIDLREFEPKPDLDTLQIGLIHLDIFAHENGLSPLAPTLWNSLE